MFSASGSIAPDVVYQEVNISDGEWDRFRPGIERLLHQGYSKGEVLMALTSHELPPRAAGVVVTPSWVTPGV